jgi:imidazole glycerol-phosphate synthase subunit HisF
MRIIARLDVKPPYLVKPIHFDGLRKLGDPKEFAKEYYEEGADEIIYIDIVSSLYQRNILFDLARDVSKDIFTPFAVGGGIKNIEDVKELIHNGADKVILNTNAIIDPLIIKNIANIFGSQAISIHIQAKKWDDWYECYTDCGRNRSGKEVISWAKEVEELGAGEIILSVIDNDGRERGFDLEISQKLIQAVDIPVVIGSGAGSLSDILNLAKLNPSGIAIASLLHYKKFSIREIKQYLINNGLNIHL